MRIKVILHGGVVDSVLSDSEADVEVISIDKDYEDYDELCAYEEKLYMDQNLKSISFSSAHFGGELE